jgi:hypothetical protein
MTTLAITGLPNSGKSSLFGALTGQMDGIAPFPFSTTTPQIGMMTIQDPMLEQLGRLEGSARITGAALEVTDTPPRNRSGGEADTQTMGRIRLADCLLIILNGFSEPARLETGPGPDLAHQAEDTILDLAINDAVIFDRALPRLRNQATSRPERKVAYQTVGRAAEITREGRMLRSEAWSEKESAALADFAPLTLKPAVWIVNEREDSPPGRRDRLGQVIPANDPMLRLTLALEAEAASLDPDDRAEMREAFGLGKGAASRVSQAVSEALGLCTFFTANARETRAWLTPRNSTARQAAGKVHSDMERGFIRAEVANVDSVIESGGWDAARRMRLIKVEGRDYVVQPRDVLQIRFSV